MRSQEEIVKLFEQVIVANELDNNIAYAYRFSDPDGVRSGKSGWSFGRSQFDTQNNPLSLIVLRECGFDDTTIRGIVNQSIDVKPLHAKLKAAAAVIDKYDLVQFRSCIVQAQSIAKRRSITFADDGGLIAMADFANQYGLGDVMKPGHLVYYLANLGRPATNDDVLRFKLDHTKYGREHPGDCKRRYNNIVNLMKPHEGG